MRTIAWILTGWALPAPTVNNDVVPLQQLPEQSAQPITGISTTSVLSQTSVSSPLSQGASTWLANVEPPTKAEVQLLRQAFAEFYGVTRDLTKSEQLLSQVITAWERQPADEKAGLYRVRGDCYTALGDADKAWADYDQAVTLLQGPGGDKADPTELPAALLGRARSRKALGTQVTPTQAQQAAADYKLYLELSSREDWDTEQELIEDGATRNPYAAWEWGSVLRQAGQWKEAATAHALAAQAFGEIGDRPRAAISLLDSGIDLAAAQDVAQATSVLENAIAKTKGIEARDVGVLQRVISKEGEGSMALAALLWNDSNQKPQAEKVLGEACVRLEQLQADAASKSKAKMPIPEETPRLKFSIDDDMPALQVSCFRFKNPVFLDQLGWPKDLQDKVIKLETLR